MLGFIGSFEHNLDSKNRLFVPAKFREGLGDTFVIRVKPSSFRHIECFSSEEFEKQVELEVSGAVNAAQREKKLFAATALASYVSVDTQGRITINSNILEKSGIEKTGLFVGMGGFVQIWNPETYNEYFEKINAEAVAAEAAEDAEAEKRREYQADGRFISLNN